MRQVFTLVHAAVLISGCAARSAAPEATPASHPALYATAWFQGAAEFAALSSQVYADAARGLDDALADPTWTAVVGDTGSGERPPAVVLDLDETVLDNSPWQVRGMREGFGYPEGWEAWCLEGRADALPGAAEFLRAAAARGVTVFYVSNRKAPVEEATRSNLQRLGLPLDASVDTVLLRDERPEWASDKTSRREHVAASYRVLMLLGDNLGDFIESGTSQVEREETVRAHGDRWGRQWFMLPNPIYGGWVDAAIGTTPESPGSTRDGRLLDSLFDGR
jgi:5'-nucleotidase (lipoprotein e(P4) family)